MGVAAPASRMETNPRRRAERAFIRGAADAHTV
jgi:hypothetical protein